MLFVVIFGVILPIIREFIHFILLFLPLKYPYSTVFKKYNQKRDGNITLIITTFFIFQTYHISTINKKPIFTKKTVFNTKHVLIPYKPAQKE